MLLKQHGPTGTFVKENKDPKAPHCYVMHTFHIQLLIEASYKLSYANVFVQDWSRQRNDCERVNTVCCQTASKDSLVHLLVCPTCLLLSRNLATPHSHETTWQEWN